MSIGIVLICNHVQFHLEWERVDKDYTTGYAFATFIHAKVKIFRQLDLTPSYSLCNVR